MMRRTVVRNRQQGFSLIEVMIALVLLGVGLLALAAMQLQAMQGGRKGQVDTYATTLAQDRVERLQHMRWIRSMRSRARVVA